SSKQIGILMQDAKTDPAKAKHVEEIEARTRALGETIKANEQKHAELETQLSEIALSIPNLLDESVPAGKGEDDNREIRRWGEPRKYDFKPLDHVEIGEKLAILDFERAAKLSGARFSVYRGAGARLERALIQFMLDLHTH